MSLPLNINQAVDVLLALAQPYDLESTELEVVRRLPSMVSLIAKRDDAFAFLPTVQLLERLASSAEGRRDTDMAATALYLLHQLYIRLVPSSQPGSLTVARVFWAGMTADYFPATGRPMGVVLQYSQAVLPVLARMMGSDLPAYLMDILPDVQFPGGEMRHPPFIKMAQVSEEGRTLSLELEGGYPSTPIFWAIAANPRLRALYPLLEKVRVQRVHTRGMYPLEILSLPVSGSLAHSAEFDFVDSDGRALPHTLFNNPAFNLGDYVAQKANEEGIHLKVSGFHLVPNHHGYKAAIELESPPRTSNGSSFLPVDLAHFFSRPWVRLQLPFLGEVEICCDGKTLYRFVWQKIKKSEQLSTPPFGMTELPWRLARWDSSQDLHPEGHTNDIIWTGFVMDSTHLSTLYHAVIDEMVRSLQWRGGIPLQRKDVRVSRIPTQDKSDFILSVVVTAPLGLSQFELVEKWDRIFRHPFDSLFRMERGLLRGIDISMVESPGGEPKHVTTYVAGGTPVLADNDHLRVGRFFERTYPFDLQAMTVPSARKTNRLPFDKELTLDPNDEAFVTRKIKHLILAIQPLMGEAAKTMTAERVEGIKEDRLMVILNVGSLVQIEAKLADKTTDNLRNPSSIHTFLNHAMGGLRSYPEGIMIGESGARVGLLFEQAEGHYFYAGSHPVSTPPTNGGKPASPPSAQHFTVMEGHAKPALHARRERGQHLRIVGRHDPLIAGGNVMANGEIGETVLETNAIDFASQIR